MSKHEPRPSRTSAPRKERYEHFELSFPGVVCFVIVLAFGAFIMHATLWDWWRNIGGARKPAIVRWSPASEQHAQFLHDPPPLQIAPQLDWQAFQREQEATLHSYGWVDKSRGIVRVPIEVAMQRIVERGLPNWPGTNQNLSPLQLQWQRAGNQTGPK